MQRWSKRISKACSITSMKFYKNTKKTQKKMFELMKNIVRVIYVYKGVRGGANS